MKILIYIPTITQEWGGIRPYSVALLRMLKEDFQNEYFIYHDLEDKEVLEAVQEIPNHYLVTSQEINASETITRKEGYNKLKNIPWLQNLKKERNYLVLNDLSTFCKKRGIEILHCPFQYVPLIKDVKVITTLHDVQELHFPEFFSAEVRAYRANAYLDFLTRADIVIVSYNHIKNDLIKYFDVAPGKIKTVLLKMDNLWVQKYENIDLETLPNNLDTVPYIFYPANLWPHKNHLKLLESIALLRDEENILVNAVFTGDMNKEHAKKIIERGNELKLSNQINFLGIVTEQTLISLYKKARAVVIPTFYEAGSFPLMESIFLGAPVICSNVTSLPETIGNNDFLFDPNDNRSIASILKKICTSEEFRNQSISNSLIQKEKLKISNSFELLMKTYNEIID